MFCTVSVQLNKAKSEDKIFLVNKTIDLNVRLILNTLLIPNTSNFLRFSFSSLYVLDRDNNYDFPSKSKVLSLTGNNRFKQSPVAVS